MRVLAAWDPDSLPGIDDEDLTGDAEREALGMMLGHRTREPLGDPIDRDPRWQPSKGLVKEDPMIAERREGIRIYQHPEALLLSEPQLWPVVSEWRSPVPRDLTREDFLTRTHFFIQAWAEMGEAWMRAQRPPADGGKDA